MAWMTSATAQSSASAATLWDVYTDVARWPEWDQGTVHSRLDSPFVAGTHGVLQPMGAAELPFTLILAVPQQGFADETRLGPATTLTFRHVLTPRTGGTQITHSIELDGAEADHMAAMMGAQLAQGLREAVDELARYAATREAAND